MAKVAIKKCGSYDIEALLRSLREALELLGGISRYVKRGERILLKPNILSGRPPGAGVNTHPEVVCAVARLVRESGGEVFVGDSPGGFGFKSADYAYETSGFKRMCKQEKIPLVEFDRARNVDGIPLALAVQEADAIISIPKMKTHGLTVITGAIKNSFGLAVGLYKTQCHFKAPRQREFARYLVDVFECAPPCLVIMDGIVAMEGEGPAGGDLRDAGLILASEDCVACDAVFAHLIGLAPRSISTTSEAHARGLGEADLSNIEVVGEGLDEAKLKDFKLPRTSILLRIPRPLVKLIGSAIKFLPAIDEGGCTKCEFCVKSCPAGCITMAKEAPAIDYRRCISCFCCFEVCPSNAISVRRSLLAQILGG